MPVVTRLVTLVDVSDGAGDGGRMSVSARHEAVLEDGHRLLLLDDRGWSAELRGSTSGAPSDIWALTSVQEIVDTARAVVGPDEPPAGRTDHDMAAGYWDHLVDVLRQHGVAAEALLLQRLPHDVVISDRLLARLRQDPDGVGQH